MGYMSTKCQTWALLDCARKASCQPKGRRETYYLFNFPQKLHKNEKEGRDTCYTPPEKNLPMSMLHLLILLVLCLLFIWSWLASILLVNLSLNLKLFVTFEDWLLLFGNYIMLTVRLLLTLLHSKRVSLVIAGS